MLRTEYVRSQPLKMEQHLKYRFILLCMLAATFSGAQTTIEYLLDQPVSDLPVYDSSGCRECIFIGVDFGSSTFRNLDVLKRFDGNSITAVEMVFSSFSRSESFDQVGLNRQRLFSLQKAAPELFDDESISWSMLRQTACHSLQESEKLFHGFVVHLAPGKSVRDREGKLMPLAASVAPFEKMPKKNLVTRDTIIREMSVTMRDERKRDCTPTGKYLPNDKQKARKGIRYDSKGKNRNPEKKCVVTHKYVYDTTFIAQKYQVNAATGKLIDRSMEVDRKRDTVVSDVMTRNWKAWKQEKLIIVQDVTGSMSDYLTQMLIWHEMYAAQGVNHYVFFNDGDNKPERKKLVGKTGGIYYVESSQLSDIQEMAQQASRAGRGGATPENNIEAILYAQKECPDCTSIVMIADNYAPVRDMELLPKVKLPVRIIVCGGNGEQVHSDYLSIAALSGGSVHTSRMDLELKGVYAKDYEMKVGGRRYKFDGKRFNHVKE